MNCTPPPDDPAVAAVDRGGEQSPPVRLQPAIRPRAIRREEERSGWCEMCGAVEVESSGCARVHWLRQCGEKAPEP